MNFGKTWRVRAGILVLALLVTSCPWALATRAQVTGATLSGTVTDNSGAAVANADISIRNVASGVIRDVATNTDGFYTAPNILPGSYEVSYSAKGFQTVVQKNLTLTVGAEQSLNIALKVGNLAQTVVVSDAPPEIQTTSSAVGATVDSRTVREIPLNGRDWASLRSARTGCRHNSHAGRHQFQRE